jgi:hypothetical protein
MKIYHLRIPGFLMAILLLFVAGCSDDEDSGATTSELLIGTWNTSAIDIEVSVGSQTLVDYLIDEVGLSPSEAASQQDQFIDSLEPEITGSLIFNADNTYSSNFGGGSDNGTWSLSGDGKTITLIEGADQIAVSIQSITSTTLVASLGDSILVDIDDDPGTPDVEITVVATLTMTK